MNAFRLIYFSNLSNSSKYLLSIINLLPQETKTLKSPKPFFHSFQFQFHIFYITTIKSTTQMAPKKTKSLMTALYPANEHIISNKPTNVLFTPNELVINKNNPIANLVDGVPGSRYDVMKTFLQTHRINRALTLNPEKIYLEYLCEFWYSAKVHPDNTITFTLKEGGRSFTLDSSVFRTAIQMNIPDNEQFDILPEDAPLRNMLRDIGYKGPQTGIISLQHVSQVWRFFFAQIVEALSGSSGGHDQVNTWQMRVAYALWMGSTLR